MQKPGVSTRKRCRKGPKSRKRLKKNEKTRTFYLKTRNKVVFLAESGGLGLGDARNRNLRSWITIVWPKIDFGIRVSDFRQLNGDFTCKSLKSLVFFAKTSIFEIYQLFFKILWQTYIYLESAWNSEYIGMICLIKFVFFKNIWQKVKICFFWVPAGDFSINIDIWQSIYTYSESA